MDIELERQFCRQKEIIQRLESFSRTCKYSTMSETDITRYSNDKRVIEDAKKSNQECADKYNLTRRLIEFCKAGDVCAPKNDVAEWFFNNGNFRYKYDIEILVSNDEKIVNDRQNIISKSNKKTFAAFALLIFGLVFWLFFIIMGVLLPFLEIFAMAFIVFMSMFVATLFCDASKEKKQFMTECSEERKPFLSDLLAQNMFLDADYSKGNEFSEYKIKKIKG